MKKTRLISLICAILSAIMLMPMLAACNSGIETSSTEASTTEAAESGTIESTTAGSDTVVENNTTDKAETEARIRAMSPLLFDVLPLNLEEVFVYEMETLGYSFKDILM